MTVAQHVKAGKYRLPCSSLIYLARSKLDLMTMLYERRLFALMKARGTDTWSSQIMSDASQQSRYNYLLTVEYRTIFPANPAAVTDMVEASPLRWFKHERRALPITVVGHGNSSYAAKAHRVLRQLATESSPQDFTDRRRTVSGWLADQNVECMYVIIIWVVLSV